MASVRVKLPAKIAQPGERRRKSGKRQLVVDSDEEGAAEVPAAKKLRIEDSTEDDTPLEPFESQEPSQSSSKSFKGDQHTSSSQRKRKTTARYDPMDDSAAEEEYSDFVDDDLLDFDDEPKKAAKVGKSTKGKDSKTKKAVKPESKEITFRDERKGLPTQMPPKQPKPTLKLDELPASAEPDSAVSTPGVSASVDLSQKDGSPPPKKRKLPTIKKNKAPSTPSSTAQKPVGLGASKLTVETTNPLPTSASVVRTPAANVGHADFDLRNKNVYNALFSSTGASRAGHVREEERRKELNKMRSEARAKRSAEANNSFDLQEQMEKILRYEQKLRPVVLFPNILAAKWKDEYERERRQKSWDGRQKEEGDI